MKGVPVVQLKGKGGWGSIVHGSYAFTIIGRENIIMKNRTILSSALSILLCLILVVGATCALFSVKAQSVAVVSSGTVKLTATVENQQAGSTLGAMLPQSQITFEENTVYMDKIVPGDFASFQLRIKNESNVTVLYRTRVEVQSDDGLWAGLIVSINEIDCIGQNRVSAWAELEPDSEDILVPIVIKLPESAGNEYQGRSCTFTYTIEAVQGNANINGRELADGIFYNDGDFTYRIYNAAGLRYLSVLSYEGENFANQKVELMNDIDLEGEDWIPIKSFAGEFDGNGKTVSNMSVAVDENTKGGLFNVIEAGEDEGVHDLTIKDVMATVGNGRFGTLANTVKGIVNRVTVENVDVTTTHPEAWVGGMCAFMSWPWMNDCTVKNMTVNAEAGARFVAGFSPILQKNSNMVFTNCNVEGFKVNINSDLGAQVAGFAGQTQRGWENPKLQDCNVNGIDIIANGNVWIGGFISSPGAHTVLDNCHASGKIDASGLTEGTVGGFFGDLGWNDDLALQGGHKVTNCTADVDITTKTVSAGGFVGTATNSNNRSMPATFTDCVAHGDIIVADRGTANVGGFAGNADRGTYIRCVADGTVAGESANDDNFIGLLLPDADVEIRA